MASFKSMQHVAPSASSASPGIWLCPHKSLNFEEAQRLALYLPPDTATHYAERLRICPCWEINNVIRQNAKSKTTSLATHVPIWEVRSVEDAEASIRHLFHPHRIEQLLCSLDVPICAHLRTSDWQVATCYRGYNLFKKLDQAFTPDHCHNDRSNALSPDTPHTAPCLKCHKAGTQTLFGFNTAHANATGGGNILILELCIIRNLTGLTDLDSPSWEMHSSTPAIPSEIRPYSWDCWQDERDRMTQLWMDALEVGTIPEVTLDAIQAEIKAIRDIILEPRIAQKSRGRFTSFFKKIINTKTPQQIPQDQHSSTAKTEQNSQDNQMNTTNSLFQMPAAECEIDRCCITWNTVNRPNRSETWNAFE